MTVPVQSTSVTSPQRKKILDVGCGQNKYPGAIGIDSNPRANADVTHDLGVLPYPFVDNEFDEIICRHVIEHVPDVMFFFFQAEDGIRAKLVTGVQTCALPI